MQQAIANEISSKFSASREVHHVMDGSSTFSIPIPLFSMTELREVTTTRHFQHLYVTLSFRSLY
jgi:hypothetical protein